MTYPHLVLTSNPHDRAALRRTDDAWLDERWADPASRVLVVSGTSDLQALVKAQRFAVKAVFHLDVARQEWRTYIVGAPTVANTLKSVKATDILMLRR